MIPKSARVGLMGVKVVSHGDSARKTDKLPVADGVLMTEIDSVADGGWIMDSIPMTNDVGIENIVRVGADEAGTDSPRTRGEPN
jgi:hypothetical protein